MKPLIILTSDDGIRARGLREAALAVRDLGELLIVSPTQQQSSSGRAFYWGQRPIRRSSLKLRGKNVPTYALDASPAVSVRYAINLVADRKPSMLISGINFGENLGSGLTISGTIGAALEAATEGVPAIAVSLETEKEFKFNPKVKIDFSVAAHFLRHFAKKILSEGLQPGTDLININVPNGATISTEVRWTRVSRQQYFRSLVSHGKFVGYNIQINKELLEKDCDIYASLFDRVVSVSPLTYDLTALPKDQSIYNQAKPNLVEERGKVFLSYAREDIGEVLRISRKLQKEGFDTYMDVKDLFPGEKWEEVILAAIRNSQSVIFVLSKNSVEKRGFFQKEMIHALDKSQELLEQDLYIFPVRLEQCDVPSKLRKYQWVDIFKRGGWRKLIHGLEEGAYRRSESRGKQ